MLFVGLCLLELCLGSFVKKFPRPPTHGVFNVVLKQGSVEFEKVSKIDPEPIPNITAWDFRLLKQSVQANFVLTEECGDVWALTSTDVVGVAAYLNTMNSSEVVNEVFSGAYEVSCENCFDYKNENKCQYGCMGGYPEGVFVAVMERGAVLQNCIGTHQTSCPEACEDGSEIKYFKNSNFSIITAYNEDVSVLRDLLTSSGPCVAEMYVHSDFMSYTDGVYIHPPENEGYDNWATVVYGYGVEDGQPYWIGKNVWGEWWGLNGFFRIDMGKNDSGFEELFICLNNNLGKGPYPNVPLPPQPKRPDAPDSNPNPNPDPNPDPVVDPDSGSPPPTPSRGWIAAIVVPVVLVVAVAVTVTVYLVWRERRRRRGDRASDAGTSLGGVSRTSTVTFTDEPRNSETGNEENEESV